VGAATTGRDQLPREKQRLSLVMLAGVGLMVAGLAAAQVFGVKPLGAATGIGVVVLFAAGVGAQVLGFRCPWCRGKLGTVLTHSGWWRMDPKVRYCPHCGAAFDDELDAPASWDDPAG